MRANGRFGRSVTVVVLAFGMACAVGCSGKMALRSVVHEPEVSLQGVRVGQLSFEAVELVADLQVVNPNPFGVSLAGLEYEFQVAGQSLLSGRQEQGLEIRGRGESALSLPVQVVFRELREALKELADADSADYLLNVRLSFDLPVLGRLGVPLSHRARLPVLRLPELAFRGLRLRSLSLSSASVGIVLGVRNPNAFAFRVQGLEYSLDVHGATWLSGSAEGLGEVPPQGTTELEIPASIDFLQLGRSAQRLIASGGSLPYRLRGKLTFGSFLPFFHSSPIAFDFSGEAEWLR
ncbi:MAG: LEA type 2 family protein [candidate division KSB1 bacterium]|nr:LEA type 2 family protein [candidate division KSB1 bacterium]